MYGGHGVRPWQVGEVSESPGSGFRESWAYDEGLTTPSYSSIPNRSRRHPGFPGGRYVPRLATSRPSVALPCACAVAYLPTWGGQGRCSVIRLARRHTQHRRPPPRGQRIPYSFDPIPSAIRGDRRLKPIDHVVSGHPRQLRHLAARFVLDFRRHHRGPDSRPPAWTEWADHRERSDGPAVARTPDLGRLYPARAGRQSRPGRSEEPDGLAVLLPVRSGPRRLPSHLTRESPKA